MNEEEAGWLMRHVVTVGLAAHALYAALLAFRYEDGCFCEIPHGRHTAECVAALDAIELYSRAARDVPPGYDQ